MADDFKFELNREGVSQLMKCSAMEDGLRKIATRTANECDAQLGSKGHGVKVGDGKRRAYAVVQSETKAAYYNNLKNNTIIKALRS